ncbi:hypothetical protein CFP56_002050 [Quercus suber]|uniref:Uncharacterized protein n=1 Tax=Quercus suber TaxID=58331 RepID=A0AAW0ILB3_QUESU
MPSSFLSQIYIHFTKTLRDEFHNFHEVNWVFCSSFDKLEEESNFYCSFTVAATVHEQSKLLP